MIEQRIAAPERPPRNTVETLIGKKINVAAPWERAPVNVVIALSSQCRFCVESAPFYRQLDQTIHTVLPKGKGSLVVISPESTEAIKKFLSDQGIAVDAIATTALASVGATGTPTLFLVDSQGIVRSAIKGKLNTSREHFILAALKNGPS